MKGATREATLCSIIRCSLSLGNQSTVEVNGTSMRPVFSEGCLAVIERQIVPIKAGDIILFIKQNRLISHRVIQIKKEHTEKLYLTKGDSALTFDYPLIRESEIAGIVTGMIKKEQIVNLRTRKWILIGRIITTCSWIVGTVSNIIKRCFCRPCKDVKRN